jgi:hypothetical protein
MLYLIFDSTASEAIAFYCEVFGAMELSADLTDPVVSIGDPAEFLVLGSLEPGRLCFKNPGTCNKRATSSLSEPKFKEPSYANRMG